MNGFAVSPENPKVMFAAMRDGLFRTADAGQSWKPVGKLKNMAAVAINPKQADEVYAISEHGKLYVSTDRGMMWTERR
ncbi:MAG: WD40/YVTN/BNR-like repeat-containing protein [Candidatus Rokuibacteriota bacterium]